MPGGDERLQRLVWERLDDAVDWLELARRRAVVWQETGNPRTVGKRFDPRGADGRSRLAPARSSSGGRLRSDEPTILCTGGFAASSDLVDALHRSRRRRCGCAGTRGRRATGSVTRSTAAPR